MGGRIVSYLVANKAMRVWQRHWFKWQHCSGNRLAVEPLARSQAWTIRGNRLLAPRRRKGRIARASQPQPVAGAEPSYESAHHSHILLQALVKLWIRCSRSEWSNPVSVGRCPIAFLEVRCGWVYALHFIPPGVLCVDACVADWSLLQVL